MARKRATAQNERPDPTPDRQLNVKFGWCADSLHDKCKYQIPYGKCGCECHKENK
jgi:hypothetical protein